MFCTLLPFKDIILNALDLISFVLVTPELARILLSDETAELIVLLAGLLMAGVVAVGILSGIIFTVVYYASAIFPALNPSAYQSWFWLPLLAGGGVFGGTFCIAILNAILSVVPSVRKYALVCGALIFGGSRLFGIALALCELQLRR